MVLLSTTEEGFGTTKITECWASGDTLDLFDQRLSLQKKPV